MAVAPNRYYNSPWIADAAKNLGSALYGDPDRELRSLQQQQIQQEMEAAKTKAVLDADDRVKESEFGNVLAQLAGAKTPEEAQQFGGRAMQLKPGKADVVSTLMGPFSLAFQGKESLQQDKLDAAMQKLNEQIEYWKGRDQGRLDLGYTGLRSGETEGALDRAVRVLIAGMGLEGTKYSADHRGQGQLLDVSPTDSENLKYIVMDKLAAKGGDVDDPAVLNAIMNRANSWYQKLRNAGPAADKAISEFPLELQPGETHWYKPNEPSRLRLRAGTNLDSASRWLPAIEADEPPTMGSAVGGGAVGTVEDGYVYIGGNRADPKSWVKVQQ